MKLPDQSHADAVVPETGQKPRLMHRMDHLNHLDLQDEHCLDDNAGGDEFVTQAGFVNTLQRPDAERAMHLDRATDDAARIRVGVDQSHLRVLRG